MRLIFFVTLFFALNVSAEEGIRSQPNAAGFPTKPGEYFHKQWKYVYEIQNEGTRSEVRIGRLYLEGKPFLGEPGELLQELFGHFIYFGDRGWNQGWLNTLTYSRPVFDSKGNPTDEARALLPKSNTRKKSEQSGEENPIPSGTSDAKASEVPDSRGL